MNAYTGAYAVEQAVRARKPGRRTALVAFLTGGWPDMDTFVAHLVAASEVADVVEVGVPFRDPMADGVSIQRASHAALDRGASLARILAALREVRSELACPVLLMSYLNPLLNHGFARLAREAVEAGVSGCIVADLPLEESDGLRTGLERHDLALVQLVTPVTPRAREQRLLATTRGFAYAVNVTGATGSAFDPERITAWLVGLRRRSPRPICCGFGVRTREHVTRLAECADGVIVGTALIEAIERGASPAAFLSELIGDPNEVGAR